MCDIVAVACLAFARPLEVGAEYPADLERVPAALPLDLAGLAAVLVVAGFVPLGWLGFEGVACGAVGAMEGRVRLRPCLVCLRPA